MSRQGIYEIVMSPTHLDMNSTSSALLVTRPVPFYVVRFGLIVTVDISDTGTTLVVNGSHEEADGTAVSPTGSDQFGTLTGPVLNMVPNSCYYHTVTGDGATNPVLPGERAEFKVSAGATDGDAFIWAQITNMPFVDQPISRLSTDPGYTTPGVDTWLEAYTECTS